jgi:hypothetical protein
MIIAMEIEYLAQLCLGLHEKDGDRYSFGIDLLLKGLSSEEVSSNPYLASIAATTATTCR